MCPNREESGASCGNVNALEGTLGRKELQFFALFQFCVILMFLEVALCRKVKPKQKRQESRGVFLLLVDFRGTCCCVGLSPLTDGSGLFSRDLSLSTPAHTYTHPVWHVGSCNRGDRGNHTATPPPAARGAQCARPGAGACGPCLPFLSSLEAALPAAGGCSCCPLRVCVYICPLTLLRNQHHFRITKSGFL